MSKPVNDAEDSDANTPRKRHDLLSHLNQVLEVAFSKYDNPRTKNSERMGWGRLITSTVAAAAEILKDAEVEDIEDRLTRLEEVMRDGKKT